MKKIIALSMALMMLLSLTVAVSADGSSDFIAAVSNVGNYVVWGGLERKGLIDTANELYAALTDDEQAADDVVAAKTTLDTYVTNYNSATNNGTLTEVSLAGNATVTEAATYKKSDGTKKESSDIGSKEKLVDGTVTDKNTNGISNSNYTPANWALGDKTDGKYNSDYYIRVQLDLTNAEELSGVRVYARKNDGATSYPPGCAAVNADIEVYDENENGYSSTTTAVMAVVDKYAFTKTQQANTDADYAYCDFVLDKTITGAKTVVVKVNALAGSNIHWGAEEIRLLKDESKTSYSIVSLTTETAASAIDAIGNYVVWGGLERKSLIDAAQAEVDKLSDSQKDAISDKITAFETYKANYDSATNSGTLTEVSLAGSATVTEAATYSYSTGQLVKNLNGGKDKIADGVVTDINIKGKDNGADTYARGDNAMGTGSVKNSDYYLKITLDLTAAKTFSGIRVYNRKGDTTTTYVAGAISTGAEIEAYKGSASYSTGKIKPVLASNGATFGLTAVKYTESDYAYYDIVFDKRLTDADKIVIKFTDNVNDQNPHWGAEEIRLLDDSTKTEYSIDSLVTENAVNAINAIGNYVVWGGIERENLIAKADAEINKLTTEQQALIPEAAMAKYDEYKANYAQATNDGALTEVSLAGKATVTDAATYKKSDGSKVKDINGIGSKNLLIDGSVTEKDTKGTQNGNFTSADYALGESSYDSDYCLKITLTLDDADDFAGVRIYSRKNIGITAINPGNIATGMDVEAYDADGNYYKSGTEAVMAITDSGYKHTSVTQANTDADYAFCDYYFAKNYGDVKTIVIKINRLAGNNLHWGAEEIRLLKDTSKTTSSVTELLKSSVVLGTPTYQSGVYEDDNTGIIRFITSFDEISENAEIVSFGTYAIKDGGTAFGEDSTVNENCAVYTVNGTDEYDPQRQPVTGENFSADITGIDEANFADKVYAISFVKIKGYNNLIISGVITDATVDSENKLVKEQ